MGVSLFQVMNNAKKAALCSSFRTLILLPILMLVEAFIFRGLSDGTTKNNIYYFIMLGFNDLISGFIMGLILYLLWHKHRHSIFNEVNKMDQEYLRNKPRHNKNKI